MKKILIYLNILIYFCLLFTSCKEESIDESIPVVPVINPIKAVTAQDGEDVANALISKDDKTIVLIFFNENDLSDVELHFKFNPRTKLVSISDTIVKFDLRTPQKLVINNLFKDVTYTIYGVSPVKLASGIRSGSGTLLWSKKLQDDLKINVLQVTGGIAALDDYLAINTRDKGSIYVNSKTGALSPDTINMNGIKGNLINFYHTGDDNNNILLCNLAPNDASNNGAFKVWKIQGVTGTPEPYITWAGGVAIGRKLSIIGSVDGDAIITAPIMGAGNRFARWQVKAGVLQSQDPQLVTITGTNINWANNVDVVSTSSTDLTADYFIAYGNNPSFISWVDGETNAINSSGPSSVLVSNAADYVVFNKVPYVIHNNLNSGGTDDTAYIYDVSTDTGLNSSIWNLTKGTYGGTNNGNGTGDVAFKVSENGFFLYTYIMFTNGSVVCIRFDCVDMEKSLPK
ncbi:MULTISPECIES: DUF5018 domain-containing protein [Proteiniphilum]|jgi:hypothetical protein|uniref:DUF5018 domain-containing protein n=1 Tax=Proteiniphilum TaxID=294702 RepID=UPI001EEA098C|nr:MULTISPECIES: DUF5018 domain-containing protein [Proteiniphilum]ULB33714.1 DUF5018 domain-containing protein [Proteiniphilum propionicum]